MSIQAGDDLVWKYNPSPDYIDGYLHPRVTQISICRRVAISEHAVAEVVEDATVCGVNFLLDTNPTCAPTNITATVRAAQVRFGWSPGCNMAVGYQVRRDGADYIGADYLLEVGQDEELADISALKAFCNMRIEPGGQLVDDSDVVVGGVGNTHEYCVRSLLVNDVGATLTSDWSCTSVVIPWVAKVGGSVLGEAAGGALLGSIVNVAVCDYASSSGDNSACSHAAMHTDTSASMADGGSEVVFVAYGKARDGETTTDSSSFLVTKAEAEITRCPTDTSAYLQTSSSADFLVRVGETHGVAWSATYPLCFVVVTFPATLASNFALTHVAMGSVAAEDVDTDVWHGFAWQFRLRSPPSWRYMSRACRRSCSLCSFSDDDCANEGGDVFCSTYSTDLNAWYSCPVFSDVDSAALGGAPDRLGAVILGFDGPSDATNTDAVFCSPYQQVRAGAVSLLRCMRLCNLTL